MRFKTLFEDAAELAGNLWTSEGSTVTGHPEQCR